MRPYHPGDEARGIRKFRQHLIWYSRGLVGGPAFRDRAVRLDRLDAYLREIQAREKRQEMEKETRHGRKNRSK